MALARRESPTQGPQSTDGTTWTEVSAAQGSGQLTTLSADGSPVRWQRLELTAASGSWWSVADLRVHT